MSETREREALREIPPVDRILADPALDSLRRGVSREAFRRAVRGTLAGLRRRVREEGWDAPAVRGHVAGGDLAADLGAALRALGRSAYRRAINATGVVLHTGLGRAPLPAAARRAIARELEGYSIVEIDVETGERSRREAAVAARLCAITGAEAGIVVNNNAAAVHLALHANLRGREVAVSRGELVEIGGGFRVPDVMRAAGVTLVEVGTTNRTRLGDYEAAIGPRTGGLLKVHPSNFRVVGFTDEVSIAPLAGLARREGLALLADLGSGMLEAWPGDAFAGEPRVRDALAAGADVVTFSGDKLLGGPQCGIALGRREWIERMRRDPYFRVLRVGKMTLVVLEACVGLWEDREALPQTLPVARMLLADPHSLRRRARALARRLGAGLHEAGLHEDAAGGVARGLSVEVAAGDSQAGSGSLPGVGIPSFVVRIRPAESGGGAAEALARRLRRGDPPVFTRVHHGAVQIDLRTVLPGEERRLVEAVQAAALSGAAAPRGQEP